MANKPMKTLTIGGATYDIVDAEARENKIDKNSIVQTTGDSTTAVMSQKGATVEFNALKQDLINYSLGVHTDGFLYIFHNGEPIGSGISPSGGANVLTPEMFGAVGNGETDDTAALQAMIDAARDGGGGKIFLFTSESGYRVGDVLAIINKHNLTFVNANLIFGESSTSRLEACFSIGGGSSNISFENCSFRYGSQVIRLWACENIRVNRCTFEGCGYCVIQQMGYVSDHVFVTGNLAKNCVQDFVECNCEVDAPSKNWTVTGNIYVRNEKPVAPMKTECRFLGATAIRNVIISDNIIENVQGDSCISLEDPYGEIVIDGNTFTDCIGRGYVHIIHGDKNTIVSNNHFVNTIADNETPFIYLYDSGSTSPYTKEFSVLVEGNLFNGNGTQKNPLVNIDYTSYPFIIKNNVFRNIGVMFDHVGGENISFDGNDVMCTTFFLVDTTKAGYTKNSTFSSNRIVGDIKITNDYNGKVCSGLSFTGNYLDGTVSITNAKDILFAQNTFSQNSVFTFDANGYYSERMERYGNFQVGVGLLDKATGEDGITPHIGENGNWYIGDDDTGVKARGEKGADGVSPTVATEAITGGTKVTITDKDGAHAFNVMNGANGAKGDKGDAGYTPQKGTDYWTAADKAEMVAEVLANFTDVAEVAL